MNDWASPWASTADLPTSSPPVAHDRITPAASWELQQPADGLGTDAQWGDLEDNTNWGVEDSKIRVSQTAGVELEGDELGGLQEEPSTDDAPFHKNDLWTNDATEVQDDGNAWESFEDSLGNPVSDMPHSSSSQSAYIAGNDLHHSAVPEPTSHGAELELFGLQEAPSAELVPGRKHEDLLETHEEVHGHHSGFADLEDFTDYDTFEPNILSLMIPQRTIDSDGTAGLVDEEQGVESKTLEDLVQGAIDDGAQPSKPACENSTNEGLNSSGSDKAVGAETAASPTRQASGLVSDPLSLDKPEDGLLVPSAFEDSVIVHGSNESTPDVVHTTVLVSDTHDMDINTERPSEAVSSSLFSQNHDERTITDTPITSLSGEQGEIIPNHADAHSSAEYATTGNEDDEFGDFEVFAFAGPEPLLTSAPLDANLQSASNLDSVPAMSELPEHEASEAPAEGMTAATADAFVAEYLQTPSGTAELVFENDAVVEDGFKVNDTAFTDLFLPISPGSEVSEIQPEELLSSTSARKTWHRISRNGTLRAYDSGDVNDYVRVVWSGSATEKKVLETVNRWVTEDRMQFGAPSFGASSSPFGPSFGWTDSPKVESKPFKRIQPIEPPKPTQRKSSTAAVLSPVSAASKKFSRSSAAVRGVEPITTESQDPLPVQSGLLTPASPAVFEGLKLSFPQASISQPHSKHSASSNAPPETQDPWGSFEAFESAQPIMELSIPETSIKPVQASLSPAASSPAILPPIAPARLHSPPVTLNSIIPVAPAIVVESQKEEDDWGDFEAFASAQPTSQDPALETSLPPDVSTFQPSKTHQNNVQTHFEIPRDPDDKHDEPLAGEHYLTIELASRPGLHEAPEARTDFEVFDTAQSIQHSPSPSMAAVNASQTGTSESKLRSTPSVPETTVDLPINSKPAELSLESSPDLTPAKDSQQAVQDPWGDLGAFDMQTTSSSQIALPAVAPTAVLAGTLVQGSGKVDADSTAHEMTAAEQKFVEELVEGLPDITYMLW